MSLEYATKFDFLSFASCLVELHGNGRQMQASVFFWRYLQQPFFITNWHVVTGNHPFSGMSLYQGWCPEKLIVRYWKKTEPSQDQMNLLGPNSRSLEQGFIELTLFTESGEAMWFQHQSFATERADVVVIPLRLAEEDRPRIYCLNDYGFSNLFHFVGCDVFVVGHPLKREAGNSSLSLPIWKRGSLASEILMPWKLIHPAFLIDCRTSSGMSGSPALRRVFGPAVLCDLTCKVDAAVSTEFMGVYTGRLDDDDGNASIGLVWRRRLIEEILKLPASGQRSL